jgi:ribosomal protein S18 acetylase RimI-like enzyme
MKNRNRMQFPEALSGQGLSFECPHACTTLQRIKTLMHKKRDPKREQKKLKKEQERKLREEIEAKINAAYELKDQMAPFNAFRKYDRNGLDVTIESFTLDTLPKDIFNWAFQLVKKNMREMYEKAWGWSDNNKKNEMRDSGALYLVAFQNMSSHIVSSSSSSSSSSALSSGTQCEAAVSSPTVSNTSANVSPSNVVTTTNRDGTQSDGIQRRPVGFVYYRYDYEPEKKSEVLYVYEIQLEPEVTGKGLGKHLMQILELMALRHKMHWILLTVFKDNKRALNFYLNHLKYIRYFFNSLYNQKRVWKFSHTLFLALYAYLCVIVSLMCLGIKSILCHRRVCPWTRGVAQAVDMLCAVSLFITNN